MKPSRLKITIGFFLFWLLIILISGGMATVLGYTPRPRLFGWTLLVVGVIVGAITTDRWAQALPGIFGVATLNSLIILISGHALNQRNVFVPRILGAWLTAVMLAAAVATWDFAGRRLTTIERVTCFGILSCFGAGIVCIMGSIRGWELPVSIGLLASVSLPFARKLLSSAKRHV